eukprot:IDg3991t1
MHFIYEVERIDRECGHSQPWPFSGLTEDRDVLLLPPQYSRDKLYRKRMRTTPSKLALSDRVFEQLFDSDLLRQVTNALKEKRDENNSLSKKLPDTNVVDASYQASCDTDGDDSENDLNDEDGINDSEEYKDIFRVFRILFLENPCLKILGKSRAVLRAAV